MLHDKGYLRVSARITYFRCILIKHKGASHDSTSQSRSHYPQVHGSRTFVRSGSRCPSVESPTHPGWGAGVPVPDRRRDYRPRRRPARTRGGELWPPTVVETSQHRTAGQIQKRVPVTAATTLAEGVFRGYYLRGVAKRAIAEGFDLLVVRGRGVYEPRPESEALVDQTIQPADLYVFATTRLVDPSYNGPFGPNSGLTVQLVPHTSASITA